MNKCENPKCGKEIVSYTGRRTKKYCSTECRNAHYSVKYPPKSKKVNPDTHKTIPIEKWNEIQEKLKSIDGADNLQIVEKEKTELPTKKTTDKIEIKYKEGIPPFPIQEEGEDNFDFGVRKSEWKQKYS